MERATFIKALTIRAHAIHAHATSVLSVAGSGIKSAIKHYLHYIASDGRHYKTADGMYYKVKE